MNAWNKELAKDAVKNYDNINFFADVFQINRISQKQIEVLSPIGHRTVYGFNTAEDCLNDYLILRKLWGC